MTSPREPNRDTWSPGLDLKGKLAVVVGASGGIGAAISVALAEAGADVVVAGRSQEALSQTAERALETGRTAAVELVDVRDPSSVADLADRVQATVGVPHILVNSMGGALHKPALEVTVEEWDELHETHLRGTFLLCKGFGRLMRTENYGKIVNLSSTWAFAVAADRSVYASAKAGISQLTTALATEWAPFGIRVNAVAPTTTVTPRVESRMRALPESQNEKIARIPLGRLATTEDVVGPVLFMASPLSDFVTGQTLLVDGGFVASKG